MSNHDAIAESIICREARTLALAPPEYTEDARVSLKARIVKELRQAADHSRANLLEASKEAHEVLCGCDCADRQEADEVHKACQKLAAAITEAERRE